MRPSAGIIVTELSLLVFDKMTLGLFSGGKLNWDDCQIRCRCILRALARKCLNIFLALCFRCHFIMCNLIKTTNCFNFLAKRRSTSILP